jgi:hypothetical protein
MDYRNIRTALEEFFPKEIIGTVIILLMILTHFCDNIAEILALAKTYASWRGISDPEHGVPSLWFKRAESLQYSEVRGFYSIMPIHLQDRQLLLYELLRRNILVYVDFSEEDRETCADFAFSIDVSIYEHLPEWCKEKYAEAAFERCIGNYEFLPDSYKNNRKNAVLYIDYSYRSIFFGSSTKSLYTRCEVVPTEVFLDIGFICEIIEIFATDHKECWEVLYKLINYHLSEVNDESFLLNQIIDLSFRTSNTKEITELLKKVQLSCTPLYSNCILYEIEKNPELADELKAVLDELALKAVLAEPT